MELIIAISAAIGAIAVLGRPAFLLYRCVARLDGMLTQWPSVVERLERIEERLGVEDEPGG